MNSRKTLSFVLLLSFLFLIFLSYFIVEVQVSDNSDYSSYLNVPLAQVIEDAAPALRNTFLTSSDVSLSLKTKTAHINVLLLDNGSIPVLSPAPAPTQSHSEALTQTPLASEDQQSLDSTNELHLFVWTHFCDDSLRLILTWPLFPNLPFYQKTTSKLIFESKSGVDLIYRAFGFLIPPLDGDYIFAVDLRTPVQLWLSEDELPANLAIVPLLHLRSNTLASDQYSEFMNKENMVQLSKNTNFYIEFFLAMKNGLFGDLTLKWLIPGKREFEDIDKSCLSSTSEQANLTSPSPNPPYPPFRPPKINPDVNMAKRDNFITLPHLSLKELDQLYPECDYSPSYATVQHIGRYRGVEMIGPMVLMVYPNDGSSFNGAVGRQNPLIPQQEAISVFEAHTNSMKEKWPEIKLISLVNMEVQRDPSKGNRFLIETEVQLNDNIKYRFSQFLYSPVDNPKSSCQPRGVRYKANAFVHIALSLKNQGPFLRYFIENMERIYRETKEENFGFIVVDFSSEDIDVEQAVKRSLVPHKKFVRMEGRYERASSLNMALSVVENENDIVYTCDLHMELPNDIVDSIRRHTFQGISGCSPVVFRLDCGRTLFRPSGYWEEVGYGLFSMYKSDWVKIGSWDSSTYKDKWGGEDWELVDRFLSKGYFMDRIMHSGLLHFFHDRSKLW